MKTKDIKKGISLIVLIITIIVVIILAAVVILTLSKNNPIESAKEARFKEDVRTFQDELALYISKQYANAGGQWDGNISAKTCDEIINYIPSFTKKYEGKFIINNNNLEYTNKVDEKWKEYAQSLNINESKGLPKEYQQVEYIESTGTQWINTGIIPKADLNGNFIIMSKLGGYPFGSTNGQSVDYWGINFYMYGSTSGTIECYYGTGSYPKVYNWSSDTKYTITIRDKKFYCNENLICDFNNINNEYSFITNNPIYLFGLNYAGGVFRPHRFYKATFWYSNSIIKDFIPCYSTTPVTDETGKQCPSGTKGLYDTVEGKFYTNQGTGEFIAGPDVNE